MKRRQPTMIPYGRAVLVFQTDGTYLKLMHNNDGTQELGFSWPMMAVR
jgi:hypothetical protein